jgi:hypothetical protein
MFMQLADQQPEFMRHTISLGSNNANNKNKICSTARRSVPPKHSIRGGCDQSDGCGLFTGGTD